MGIRVDSTPNNTEHSYKAPTKVIISSTIGSVGGVGCYLHNLTKSSDGKNIHQGKQVYLAIYAAIAGNGREERRICQSVEIYGRRNRTPLPLI